MSFPSPKFLFGFNFQKYFDSATYFYATFAQSACFENKNVASHEKKLGVILQVAVLPHGKFTPTELAPTLTQLVIKCLKFIFLLP